MKNAFKGDLSLYGNGKVQPQAKEAEEAVLGAVMLYPAAFAEASEIISPDSFYVDSNRMIFEACKQIKAEYSQIDLITVTDQLTKNGTLDIVGGIGKLIALTKPVSGNNIADHCKIIYEKYLLRELIRNCAETLNAAYADNIDAFNLLDEHSGVISGLSLVHSGKDYTSLIENVEAALTQIEQMRESKQELTGAPSGIQLLDSITQGFQPSDMIVLAARPGIGKSAIAGNIAVNAALHPIKPTKVGVFTLEMSTIQWVFRILAAQSEIDGNDLKRGRVTDDDLKYLRKTVYDRLKNAGIFFDDTASLKMAAFKAKARKMVLKEGVGLLILDYMQLVSPDDGKGSREQEVSKISREIKQLAKELHVPIIALSQFNRVADGVKPRLSHLRESGAIEQDADMVIFLIPLDEKNENGEEMTDSILIEIAKYRNGAKEPVPIRFVREIQKIFSDEYEYQRYVSKRNGSIQPTSNFRPLKIPEYAPAKNHFEVDTDTIEDKPF